MPHLLEQIMESQVQQSQFGPDDVTLFMWQAEQDSVVDLVSVGIGSKNL
jgi:hypothetical protein